MGLIDKEIDLAVSNYGTTRELDYALAVLPWGSTEPHNYHLPYLTDAILSHDIAVDAARYALGAFGVRAMVLPPVTLGSQNPGQRDLKFCIHARQETQKAILTDIVDSLLCQGISRLVIINGHGGNSFKGMIRDLAVDRPRMLIAAAEWYKVVAAEDFFDRPGDHADELETSVMMHYHSELVNLDEAGEGRSRTFAVETLREGVAWVPRDWSRVSDDTGIGDPSCSTAAKGSRYVGEVVRKLGLLIRDMSAPSLY